MYVWDLIRQTNNLTYFNYFLSVRKGAPASVDDLAPSDDWESADEEKAAMKMKMDEWAAEGKRARDSSESAFR